MKRKILSAAAVAAALTLGSWAQAQRAEPDNGRPNPYRAIEAWATLPDGSLEDGGVTALIGGSNPEGVAVDAAGNVYGAVVSYGGNLIRHERLQRTDLNSQAPQ